MKTYQAYVEQQLKHLFAIIEHAPAFISTADRDGNITYFNKTARQWAGLQDDEQPQGWRLSPEAWAVAQEAARRGVWQGERDDFLRRRGRTEKGRAVLQTVRAHKGPDGEVDFYSTIAIDISKQKALEQERLRLLSVVEDTPAIVSTADAEGRILYFNRAGRALLGIDGEDGLETIHISDIHPPWAARLVLNEGMPAAARDGSWQGETAVLDRDGREIPTSQIVVSHKNAAGEVEYFSTIAQDMTERKRMEAKLRYMATHDGLTGVTNRTHFQECLARELARAKRSGQPGAVLYLDLDNFKHINDTLGHHAGDEILQRVAHLVQGNLRSSDMLARLGGDEFAVLLPETSVHDAKQIGERLLTLLSEETVCHSDATLRVQASMGIATFPHRAATVEDVLIHADLSMYAAKRQGGNRLSVYDGSDEATRRAGLGAAVDVERMCQDAVQKDRLLVYRQPVVNLQTDEGVGCGIVGYALSLRMKVDEGRLLLPEQFVPECERAGKMPDIEKWLLAQAFQGLAGMTKVPGSGSPSKAGASLYVPLSRNALNDEELLTELQRLAARAADPSRIVITLSEIAVMENVNRAIRFMNGVREAGCRVALDDFGVGFSTFGALRRLPVDELKIDGSLIADLTQDPVQQHFIRAIVEIAQGLEMNVVAKAVPDAETAQLLTELGVPAAQGGPFGEPEPVVGTARP